MIQKNRSGSFTVIWRDPSIEGDAKDKRRFKTFERYKEAQSYEGKLREEMKDGSYTGPSDHTLKDMGAVYLDTGRRRWKIQTYNSEKSRVEGYIIPRLGHRKMTEVKFAEIERAGDAWKASGLDGVTVNKIYDVLNRIYKFARKHGVKFNPMPDVERMKSSTSLEEIEMAAVAGAIPDIGEETKESDGILRAIGADEVLSAANWTS